MSRIRILSEHLANQIAAGEVVERPASVVKELLENSLDAGADRVDIQIEGGGSRLIRIVDNGQGMDGDDVMLCLERHATSKLTTEEELSSIATLGFRGEALPSIGSVSRMTILSRSRQAATGTRADIRYGVLNSVHENGCSRGTMIEVRNLFGNLPARKKFLKTRRTELSHIDEVIRSQSLAHPGVAFSLQVEGRTIFDFSATDLEGRVRDVFRYSDTLLPVQALAEQDDPDLQIQGYLLLPDSAPAGRLRILVNGRPVQDRMIRHAVLEGLQGFLMKGHQPAGALLLTLSPEQVDVNVHPAKREIRFRKSAAVHRLVARVVADAIRMHQEHLRSSLFSVAEPSDTNTERLTPEKKFQQVQESLFQPSLSSSITKQPGITGIQTKEPEKTVPLLVRSSSACQTEAPTGKDSNEERQLARVGGLTLIGQFLQLYLLCERDKQLVVIDQHAAHERILFQKMLTAYQSRKVPRQSLLFPVTVELGPDHAETMERMADTVAELGLDVDFFGDSTWVIKAVPAQVSALSAQDILFDVLEGLRGNNPGDLSAVIPEYIESLLASMACKAAIKAGNRLQPREMLDLLEQMEHSDVFSHCPHGRPVIKTFTPREIEQWFHRT